ncbi:MAG: RNA polymerase sigma factor RpoD/SigA [Verrucomicrobia bacterium]|nr:RNA polymerase sigma factor RpoD/SigA [Verrucomicrobiota bacterium]
MNTAIPSLQPRKLPSRRTIAVKESHRKSLRVAAPAAVAFTAVEPRVEIARTPVPPVVPASVPYESKSALSLYMREAVEVPLLTIEEENALAARIKRGDMEAREHMIRANLRLVVKIARDYDGFGLPLLDLINEGNIGLMKGVERFDPAKGGKLSTYASWWIKQSIKRALANQSKTIRLPVHLVDKVTRMKRVAHQLQDLLGREATDEELAEEMEVPVKKIRFWQRAAQKTASLDAPLGDDESSRLADVVPDGEARDPYGRLEEKTTHRMVGQFLGILDSRELSILRQRFGLDGHKEKTLDEIGRGFGVTRERIRQLQNIALAKLRERIEQHEAVRAPAGEGMPWEPAALAVL